MRLLSAEAWNFCSYEHLSFNFNDVGLALVYGPTGAGKSTLQDLPCWVLYGQTAKGGNVDEVKSWNPTGDRLTAGTLAVDTPAGVIFVTRTRGKGAQNDLYWKEQHSLGHETRGKDIVDTQKLLNARLGVNYEQYVTGAYFHEFSPTGAFFTATAKQRRAVFESITNVGFVIKLQEKLWFKNKDAKAEVEKLETSLERLRGEHEQVVKFLDRSLVSELEWENQQKAKIGALKRQAKNFETDKGIKVLTAESSLNAWNAAHTQKIGVLKTFLGGAFGKACADKEFEVQLKALEEKARCSGCGQLTPKYAKEQQELKDERIRNKFAIKEIAQKQDELSALESQVNPYITQYDAAMLAVNAYGEQLKQEAERQNPHKVNTQALDLERARVEVSIDTAVLELKSGYALRGRLECLIELATSLRGELLKKSVQEIESETARCLDTYFDGEFRVRFTLAGSDSLDIDIEKSGNPCVYKQLSKGQRQLLKLCFAVAVMKVSANNAGIYFANLFFDEALDGLDEALKIKAFGLLEELEKDHQSVMVIDHNSEFQSLFTKRYRVELVGDTSQVTCES